MDTHESWLQTLLGCIVVVDLDESYLAIGHLAAVDSHHLALEHADLHDHREANCTKEVYLLESRKLGVRANRQRVSIPRSRMLAIGLLEDVTP